ncbi:MAG: hypothetical protein EOP49_20435 [Sphingobacteriales bacterium]|nr:MAG: hypothetical protein EOP49_20435 [Sphingobacteriales bacterium]
MFPYGQIIEAACLLAALFFLRGEKRALWQAFKVYLAFVLVLELVGAYLSHNRIPNGWLYKLALPIQTLFPGYVLYSFLTERLLQRLFWMGAAAFAAVYIFSLWQSHLKYSFICDLASSIFLVLTAGSFYYDLLQRDETVNLGRFAPYWLATGILLFNCGSIVVGIFAENMGSLYIGKVSVWGLLFTALTLILSLCWSNAFRWHYRANT